VVLGRGLCDELITHPEESYRLWRVLVCDPEKILMNEEAKAHLGAIAPREKKMPLLNSFAQFNSWFKF
jgi:hypothetical protein